MKVSKLLFFLIFLACDQIEVSKQVFSQPEWNQDPQYLEFSLAVTSKFQGKLYEQLHRYKEAEIIDGKLYHHNIPIGGRSVLQNYRDIFKKKYADRFLLIDTGDIFESPTSFNENEKTLKHYESLHYDAVGFTKKDYLALNYLASSSTKAPQPKIPFVAENIIDLQLGSRIERPYLSPYKIIEKDGIRFGLIFLETFKGPESTVSGIYIQDPIISLLQLKKTFQKKKVDFTIISINSSTACRSDQTIQATPILTEKDDIICPSEDPLLQTIQRMPPLFGDLIIAPSETMAIGHLKGRALMTIPGQGKFMGRAKIVFNKNDKKIISEKTVMLPALKLCHYFFSLTNDCYIPPENSNDFKKRMKALSKNKFEKTKASFLGEIITPSNI